MVTEHTFTASGIGRFPIDMLRYDGCRPRQSSDSRTIEHTFGQRIVTTDPTDVNLIGMQAPTVARWASFGWHVSQVERRRV